ncbi:MAG: restriction endonuclease subunit S, partial [Thermodesulfobacteriota bacterium]|nr:restriction endonuclease subunit S [Thermodesulfobacteriota bacterium]
CFRFSKLVPTKYFDFILKETNLLEQIYKTATGAANQANIGINSLRGWIVPLPPLAEQQAIVTKIHKLYSCCDQLEEQINQSKSNSELLMQTVLKEAFAS